MLFMSAHRYEMVQCCCSLERYAYICVFEQIGNFSDLWAVESKCSPGFFNHSC